jgi:N-acetyl-anhydromuramyl-L-alanine amidase AmpD
MHHRVRFDFHAFKLACYLAPTLISANLALAQERSPALGAKVERLGDEIMVCGQLYHTTTRVVLWVDPGGYDAYRVERRFAPLERADWGAEAVPNLRRPNRYRARTSRLSPPEIERVRGGGWDLPLLQRVVDQFVIHFDARGTSRGCFEILHDVRGLSVHFMLDLDGTIYQTLDVKESAQHATIANARSIGIEIANIGAYLEGGPDPFDQWYKREPDGEVVIVEPGSAATAKTGDRKPALHPSRSQLITGTVQGQRLRQYDFTREQYDALARLTATLCKLFPSIACDYPRDRSGALVTHKLPDIELARYHGILGHFHVQTNKVDPGPAFQWDAFLASARALMEPPAKAAPRPSGLVR